MSVRATLKSLQMKRTVSGGLWATLEIEEAGVSVVVLVFPGSFANIREGVLSTGAMVDVAGSITFRSVDHALRLNARSITAVVVSP